MAPSTVSAKSPLNPAEDYAMCIVGRRSRCCEKRKPMAPGSVLLSTWWIRTRPEWEWRGKKSVSGKLLLMAAWRVRSCGWQVIHLMWWRVRCNAMDSGLGSAMPEWPIASGRLFAKKDWQVFGEVLGRRWWGRCRLVRELLRCKLVFTRPCCCLSHRW